MWQEALAIFLESYCPTDNLQDSTHQFTTNEICMMLEKHSGGIIEKADLVRTLSDKGFKYIRTGDLTLEWLMIQAPIVAY